MRKKRIGRKNMGAGPLCNVNRNSAVSACLFVLGFLQLAVGIGIQHDVPLVLASCLLYAAVRRRTVAAEVRSAAREQGAQGCGWDWGEKAGGLILLTAGAVVLCAVSKSGSFMGLLLCGGFFWFGGRQLLAARRRGAEALSAGGRQGKSNQGRGVLPRLKKKGRPLLVVACAGLFLGSALADHSAVAFLVGLLFAYFGVRQLNGEGTS